MRKLVVRVHPPQYALVIRLTRRPRAPRAPSHLQPVLAMSRAFVALCVLACTSACAASTSGDPARSESAFAAVQARGADPRAMGVDQSTSVHRFDMLPDGGRIELQRAVDDSAGVAQIRRHLREIAGAFAQGDFSTPAFVHVREVPGTAVMAARRAVITYAMRELPRGGEVRITTTDPQALTAIHQFIAFQRGDHRAGGAGDGTHHGAKHP